jgi:hypothetical protein
MSELKIVDVERSEGKWSKEGAPSYFRWKRGKTEATILRGSLLFSTGKRA